MIMFKHLCVLVALLVLAQTDAALAATAPPLGLASGYAVLGATTVTNTGFTTIHGDLGLSPGTSITGFPPGTVIGTTHQADATAANAQSAATAAYNDLVSQACNVGPLGVTDLAGAVLTPGVYCYSSSLAISTGGILTLDAGGNANAVWVFKMGSTLTTVSGASVVLANGAQQSNVFWQVGSSATLGTTTVFKGTIIALTSITVTTGANVAGRVLALNGAVTLDSNIISAPHPELTIAKSVIVHSDPINAASNPKAIPGALMTYTITVLNSGSGPVDSETTLITDPIPTYAAMFVSDINGPGSGPVLFTQGGTSSGLSYTFVALGNSGDNVDFSNNSGLTWTYVPTPGVDGCDPLVTNLRINPKGQFVGTASPPNPGFSLSFRVCVK
jgi:type VI secretion system secreted protein VgrG